jgi:hypothetical protein
MLVTQSVHFALKTCFMHLALKTCFMHFAVDTCFMQPAPAEHDSTRYIVNLATDVRYRPS